MKSCDKQNMSRQINSQRMISYRTNQSFHPSFESNPQPYKPCIKVGYSVIKPRPESKIMKKRVESVTQLNSHTTRQGKKHINGSRYQNYSGVFKDSEYCEKSSRVEEQFPHPQRKSVHQAYKKYYQSKGVKENLIHNPKKQQLQTARSVERPSYKMLPSYGQENIKGIIEYGFAGKYRETVVTQKCTKTNAMSRFLKFNDVHEYDFRKKPEFLR